MQKVTQVVEVQTSAQQIRQPPSGNGTEKKAVTEKSKRQPKLQQLEEQ